MSETFCPRLRLKQAISAVGHLYMWNYPYESQQGYVVEVTADAEFFLIKPFF